MSSGWTFTVKSMLAEPFLRDAMLVSFDMVPLAIRYSRNASLLQTG
jgi:hypothetical protein